MLLAAALEGLDHYLDQHQSYPRIDHIRARCRGILKSYAGLYAKSDTEQYQVLSVEEVLIGPVLNPLTQKDTGYIAGGKLDVKLIQKKNGKRSILDHKVLSSQMDDHHREHLLVDTQPLQYAYLEHLNGERIDSAIWDVISKTSHRVRANDTVDDFEDRIHNMYSSEPDEFFARKEFPILQHHLAQYGMELHAWTQNIHSARLSGEHLKTPESCFLYNRPCRYLSLCSGRTNAVAALDHGLLVQIDNPHPELPLPEGVDPHQVITNSRLKTFRHCMRKHDLQYNLGIRKAGEITEEPLFVGSAMHSALEFYWRALQSPSTN